MIDDFTRDVLRHCTIEGRVVKLPGRLSKPDFRFIDGVLVAMGGRWIRSAESYVFDVDPAGPINAAVAFGRFTDRRKTLQQIETSAELAEQLADLCDIRSSSLLLEPSAGTGVLCRAALARGADVAAIERDHINIAALRAIDDPRLRVWHDDFLRWADRQMKPIYDRVLMHPPFTAGAGIAHVMAAWRMLRPEGRLVAVVAGDVFTSRETQAEAFQAWLTEVGAEEKPVRIDVDGTGLQARVVIADRETGHG